MKKILFSLMKHTFKFENIIEFIFKINKKILNFKLNFFYSPYI